MGFPELKPFSERLILISSGLGVYMVSSSMSSCGHEAVGDGIHSVKPRFDGSEGGHRYTFRRFTLELFHLSGQDGMGAAGNGQW